MGVASPAALTTRIMSSTWASVVPTGKVPKDLPPPLRRPLCPSWRAGFSPIPTKSGASRASGLICGSWERRRPGPVSAASRSLQKIVVAIVGAPSRARREQLRGSSPPRSTNLDKIFDQALILWCGMVTCGRAEIPVLGRDMGALGFKFPTTHRAYGGEGSEFRRAEGGMVRSSEGTQRRSFSSLG